MLSSHAVRLAVTTRGLVVPDKTRLFSRHQWADIALAVLCEANGNMAGEKYLIDRLEIDFGVTEHDRLVADHGADVVAGQHCSLDRPRRARLRARKPVQDPAVFTRADLIEIAKAERKLKHADLEQQQKGRDMLQVIVDRRERRILEARAASAVSEATALADLRDGAVRKIGSGRFRRVDGLELLKSTNAVTDFGLRCARRYGQLYAATQPRSSYRSCLAEPKAPFIDQRSDAELAAAEQEARARAESCKQARDTIDRMIVAATGAKALLLLQQVAGEGASIASLSSSGPMRAVFRREVIAAIAVLEVIYTPPPVQGLHKSYTREELEPFRTKPGMIAEITTCVDEDGAFVREVVVLRRRDQ